MSDVRCPMCGKPNPEQAEICNYCQARLKPFNLSSSAPAGNEPEVPNWLTSLRGSDQDQPESSDQSEPVSDLVTGLRLKTSAEEVEQAGAEQPDYSGVAGGADRQVPDWLAAAEQSLQAEGDQSTLPDWLGQAGYSSQAAPSRTSDEPSSWLPPKDELEDISAEASSSGSVAPFQFAEMENEPELTAAENVTGSRSEDTIAADLSWLDEMEASFPGMTPASDQAAPTDFPPPHSGWLPTASSGAFAPASPLPAWLTQATTPEQPVTATEAEEPDKSGLAPAELPDWLKSMQPTATMDSQAKEQAERGQVESGGPLMGLKGILHAEPDIVQATKPPVYSTKLRITDLQHTHAKMLAELVQAEGDVKALPSAPLFTSQGLLRVLIALVLIGVILLSMALGAPRLIEPELNQEVFAASQLIAGLPSGVPVLVVVDFAPGFSGDVSLLLGSVIDHLATKNETIALVSSIPTGPLQVESLIAQVKARPGLETIPIHYANLGYIPGGPSGILAFIQDPTRALPGDAWRTPSLQNIHSLTDFALLVIATENPETARMWIEQVRPVFPNLPIVMALSAQAEPLVRPYYNASPQQIQGMLGGYSAGVMYDTTIGRRTNSATLWSPFAAGLTAAVLLMVIGLLVNLLLGLLVRTREKERSSEKA